MYRCLPLFSFFVTRSLKSHCCCPFCLFLQVQHRSFRVTERGSMHNPSQQIASASGKACTAAQNDFSISGAHARYGWEINKGTNREVGKSKPSVLGTYVFSKPQGAMRNRKWKLQHILVTHVSSSGSPKSVCPTTRAWRGHLGLPLVSSMCRGSREQLEIRTTKRKI